MHLGSLSNKGQTTIPAGIREILKLHPGDKLEFFTDGDSITVIPINKSVTGLKGILKKPSRSLSCEEMDDVIRGRIA